MMVDPSTGVITVLPPLLLGFAAEVAVLLLSSRRAEVSIGKGNDSGPTCAIMPWRLSKLACELELQSMHLNCNAVRVLSSPLPHT